MISLPITPSTNGRLLQIYHALGNTAYVLRSCDVMPMSSVLSCLLAGLWLETARDRSFTEGLHAVISLLSWVQACIDARC